MIIIVLTKYHTHAQIILMLILFNATIMVGIHQAEKAVKFLVSCLLKASAVEC